MKKYLTVFASFVVMLCLGGVYSWSLFASELMNSYNLPAYKSQLIFGTVIALFSVSMIFAGRYRQKKVRKYFGMGSGLLFFMGYFLAGLSQGNFLLLYFGIGILSGIAIGLGYWLALTYPVLWFPVKKGLVTGIAAAGFGLGAVFTSEISEIILNKGYNVLQLLQIIAVSYGLIIIFISSLISQPYNNSNIHDNSLDLKEVFRTNIFKKLLLGIFLGTFAGLLIIGSLSIIGSQFNISHPNRTHGIALFALANFCGRLFWGFFSDHYGAANGIFLALLVESLSIISLNVFTINTASYLALSFLIGFGFGGNFVLFTNETSRIFGAKKMSEIYPYIFTGYAVAGITGPFIGGILFDLTGSFFSAIILAGVVGLAGSLLFSNQYFKKNNHEQFRKN